MNKIILTVRVVSSIVLAISMIAHPWGELAIRKLIVDKEIEYAVLNSYVMIILLVNLICITLVLFSFFPKKVIEAFEINA